jgi:Na+/alanine symporter
MAQPNTVLRSSRAGAVCITANPSHRSKTAHPEFSALNLTFTLFVHNSIVCSVTGVRHEFSAC